MLKTKTEKYIERYMQEEYGSLDDENIFVGTHIFNNVSGKVLDFGCGPSMLNWVIFMQNARLIDGLDLLPENIAYVKKILAQRRKPAIYYEIADYIQAQLLKQEKEGLVEKCFGKVNRLEVADMLKPLPFKKNFYDCATEIGCIGCVNTDDELITAVKNMYGCLKKGGRAVIVNWDDRQYYNKDEAHFDGTVKISKEIFEKVFSKVGFKDVTIAYQKNAPNCEYQTIIYGTAIK